jgi:hypothetical protein
MSRKIRFVFKSVALLNYNQAYTVKICFTFDILTTGCDAETSARHIPEDSSVHSLVTSTVTGTVNWRSSCF